ncbi:MAG: hypothetical protein K1X74_01340 [Pirellulales bacterium]|nr:hypothetical protein [Pirellulales bacterium]
MSTMPPPPPGAQFSAEPPARSGSGWWFLGCGCLGFLVLCCGGLGGVGYFAYVTFANAFSTDPVVVQQVADEVGGIQMPEGFQPLFSINLDMKWMQLSTRGAIFENKTSEGFLAFGEIKPPPGAQVDAEAIRKDLKQQMEQQGHKSPDEIQFVGEPETRELMVRGEPTTFTFRKGKKADSDKEFTETLGTFTGHDGATGILWIVAPTEALSVDQAAAVAESIQ